MANADVLPRAAVPTNHPWYENDGRHPRVNVFSLQPIPNVGELSAGTEVRIELAQFVDPTAEMDYQRLVASRPRWTEGLLLRVGIIKQINEEDLVYTGYPENNVYPDDYLFAGAANVRDETLSVVGMMNAARDGWLGFEADAFGDRQLDTIADLKEHVGVISSAEAQEQNRHLYLYGRFMVGDVEHT